MLSMQIRPKPDEIKTMLINSGFSILQNGLGMAKSHCGEKEKRKRGEKAKS